MPHPLRLGSLLIFASLAFFGSPSLPAAPAMSDEDKIAGFAVGCQAYTFNHFSVFEAIEKTAQAGGKVIEFYPGQKLCKEEPEVKWDHTAKPETIQKVKDKLAE